MENYFQPGLPRDRLLEISSIGLAHMGDAVFELLVRAWLCAHGGATGRGMHRAAVSLVCAESQAEKAEKILPLLTEEERGVFRRGRNAQVTPSPTTPAGPSTARPRPWRRCWAGSTSGGRRSGSTTCFAR